MGRNKCLYSVVIIGLFFIFGCRDEGKQPEDVVEVKSIGNDTLANNTVSSQQGNVPTLPSGQAPAAQNVSGAQPQEKAALEKDIQQALKNAGFYQGEIDGKIGPKTKKAIEDFQAKNNLKVDGKVGPMTWGKLSAYLNTDAPELQADTPDLKQEIKD
jgi:peptidoglycan hydrolase-like protein with peptidoglycan-binding domain